MKYFFDNCISPKLAEMLRALGEDVTALKDQYPPDIDDVSLFKNLKGQQLVFVSTDIKQLTRSSEARALKQAGNTALYFGPFFLKKKFWEQAAWIVQQWKTIDGFARGAETGTCAEIKHNGRASIYRF